MDFHEYQIFNTFQIEMNFTQHLQVRQSLSPS